MLGGSLGDIEMFIMIGNAEWKGHWLPENFWTWLWNINKDTLLEWLWKLVFRFIEQLASLYEPIILKKLDCYWANLLEKLRMISRGTVQKIESMNMRWQRKPSPQLSPCWVWCFPNLCSKSKCHWTWIDQYWAVEGEILEEAKLAIAAEGFRILQFSHSASNYMLRGTCWAIEGEILEETKLAIAAEGFRILQFSHSASNYMLLGTCWAIEGEILEEIKPNGTAQGFGFHQFSHSKLNFCLWLELLILWPSCRRHNGKERHETDPIDLLLI